MANHLIRSLLQAGRAAPERIFAKLPDGSAVSYADLDASSAQLANCLVERGLKPGERLALQAGKSLTAVMLYLATIRAGGVFLPLNTAYTAAEVEYFLRDAEPVLFVCDLARRQVLEPLARDVGADVETLGAASGAAGSLQAAAAGASAIFQDVDRGPGDLAAILYTSGTTGRSKGAMLTHDNLLSNARTLAESWRFTGDDVLLHALPIFHTHGLFVAINTIALAGGSMIFLPKFDLDAVFAHLPASTAMMGVPTFYTRLLADRRLTREATGHMRLFTSGSAPLLAETHAAFEERTGHRILERYGMTETNMTTSNPYEGPRRPGTVGPALPGIEVRITDPETARPMPVGEIGMIEVRGPNVFSGYWRMPEKTAEEMRDDGFFVTGDLGFTDEEGYVTIVGRGKDLIISGGLNVYPKEVELAINDLPGVTESAVIGVPDADFGEAVVAVVVAPEIRDEKDILSALRDRLAKFKQPKRVIFVDKLPRNSMGKVQKNVLRDTYASARS